jgi:opacity protein-like surface antigen
MKSNLQSIWIMLLVFLPVFAHAQSLKLNVNYAPSLPVGNFKNVTDGFSWRGWEGNLFYETSSKLMVGIGIGSQAYYKKYPQSTYHFAGSDITAVVNNSIELMPVMARVRYAFGMKTIHPYVGVGAGINLIRYDTYYGEFVDYNHTTKFAAQPELGVAVPFGRNGKVGLDLAAGYNYMPFKNNDVDNLSNVSFKGGLSIRLD